MKFAIISPATEVKPFYIDGAAAELRRRGHEVTVFPHAKGPRCGTFAAPDADRLADLRRALTDPDIDVILCARGGYGCNHLISKDLEECVKNNPKWLIGFSDVSALHALWLRARVSSLHASMAKQLTLYSPSTLPADVLECVKEELPQEEEAAQLSACTDAMFAILNGEEIRYDVPPTPLNIPGMAEGEIVGGNLAVLNGLAATPWDILDADYLDGKILFLEDVGEKIYQIERMLKRLQLSGALSKPAAIIFGQFTDYKPDRNFDSMESMISARLKEWGISCPVAFNFPIGHTHHNLPIPEGARARLRITLAEVSLTLTP